MERQQKTDLYSWAVDELLLMDSGVVYFRFARCSSRFALSRGCDPARLALWRQFMHTSSLHSDARVNPFLKSFIAVTIGMDAHECVVVSVLARRRP
jgi:hypothetical protein